MCALYQVPLLVCGDNGTGKTEMLRAIQSKIDKSTQIINGIDLGGLTTLNVSEEIKTLFISDMQLILSRRKTTQSTIGALTTLITDYGMGSYMYNGMAFRRQSTLSFIIACTPLHLQKMIRYGYRDFLSRFLLIFVERPDADRYPEGYRLHGKVVKKSKKISPKMLVEHQKMAIFGSNMREKSLFLTLILGKNLMGFDDSEFEVFSALSTESKTPKIDEIRRHFRAFSIPRGTPL